MRLRPASVALVAGGLVAAALLTAGCSSTESADAASDAPTSEAATSEAPTSEAPASEAATSASPEAASSPSVPAKPSVGDMSAEQFADAVLEQIRMDGADAPSDQLVTIAMSPLLRQLASSADMTTRLKSKGDSVSLVLSGRDTTCIVRVTDQPASRGVTCR